MKGVYIFLAEGFEDIEALATRDVLLRGGVDVKTVGITDEPFVCSSRGLCVAVDMSLEELAATRPGCGTVKEDFLIFPGGLPGSRNLGECKDLIRIMNEHYLAGGSVAAICVAPSFVLGKLKGMENADFTCYDGCQDNLLDMGAHFHKRPYVKSGRIITGRGPGHSIDFALAVLKDVKGAAVADEVASGLTLPCE